MSPDNRMDNNPLLDGVMDVLYNLAKEEELKTTVFESVKGGVITGTAATIGGVCLGPVGFIVVGGVGTLLAAKFCRDFKPLHQVLAEMEPEKKRRLFDRIKALMTRESIMDVATLCTMVAAGTIASASNKPLKHVIIKELADFTQSEFGRKVVKKNPVNME